jgi:hypothetical protein
VPEVSRFAGIVIAMYRNDHPPPHFHARYGSSYGRFEIESGSCAGSLPPKERRLVLEWLKLHRAELLANWSRLEQDLELIRIAPLE